MPTPKGAIRLAAPENVEAYASDLYAALRKADMQEIKIVKVMQPNGIGLAEAIRERLTRASS
jgi:L-threonylcarbamoyladenylate synthase